MSEPRRWLEGAGPVGAGALLRAGLAEVPSQKSLQRTLLAVSATTIAATAAGGALGAAAAQSAGTSALVFISKCAAVGVVSAGVIVGAAVGIRQLHLNSVAPTGTAVSTAASVASVMSPARRIASVDRPAPLADVPGENPTGSSELALTAVTAPAPVSSAVRSPSIADTAVGGDGRTAAPSTVPVPSEQPADNAQRQALSEELLFIDAARLRLRSGDASGAIERVREYEQRSDFGHFLPEALYLRMQAELQLGNRTAAAAAAHEMISRFPRAPQVRRASEILKSLGEDTLSEQTLGETQN